MVKSAPYYGMPLEAHPASQTGNPHLGSPLNSPPQLTRNQDDKQARPTQQRQGQDRPPMNVIVVSSSTGTELRLGQSSPKRESNLSSLSSPFSAPFLLQPRNALVLASTAASRRDVHRGRKRSAHSMSAAERGSLLTAKPVPSPHHPSQGKEQTLPGEESDTTGDIFSNFASPPKMKSAFGATPPKGKRSLGMNSLANFQCLSLKSPKRNVSSPPEDLTLGASNATTLPPSSSFSPCSGKRPVMVANSVGSFRSQPTPPPSITIPPRSSSFTPVYSAASPGGSSIRSYGSGSIGSNTRMNTRAPKACFSPSSGSNRSSPKTVSLTVLQDRGAKLPALESRARLPPLPAGGVDSLWFSLDSSSDSDTDSIVSPRNEDGRMRPPRTVHCRQPSFDSVSTGHNSILSPFAGSSLMSPRAMPSPISSALGAARSALTSRSQQLPGTPQTPLPRVTLTPRSTGSRRNGQNGNHLPRFPSPSDINMDVTSPFLSSAAATSLKDVTNTPTGGPMHDRNDLETTRNLFPGSSNSLALSVDGSAHGDKDSALAAAGGHEKAPLPMLDLSMNLDESENRCESPTFRTVNGGTFLGNQTISLLTAPGSGGVLEAMMEEERKAGSLGSVSDIDEDEGFFLAAPGTIEEERFASCQPARQRRRRSVDPFAAASPSASNTNLAGLKSAASSTSLFGMDIDHPMDSSGIVGSESRPFPGAPATHGSTVSHGSASSISEVATASHFQAPNRYNSDTNQSSVGLALENDSGRDLVTPPPMATPQTPPLLSPKEGFFLPLVHQAVCVAGADS